MSERVAYTEQQQAEFKATFARRKRLRMGSIVAFVGALVLSFAMPESIGFPFGRTGPPAAVLVAAVMALFSLVIWRCPACSKMLSNEWNPKFCSKCGIELQ